jgi:hypothetical protein
MPQKDCYKVTKLLNLQKQLLWVGFRVGEVLGRSTSQAYAEYKNYTKGWLRAFANDLDQSGSIASLIDSIIGKYVDEDGVVWKD